MSVPSQAEDLELEEVVMTGGGLKVLSRKVSESMGGEGGCGVSENGGMKG